MTGLSAVATTSRMMWMDSASSLCRWVSMFYALRLKDVGVKDILAIVHQIFIRKMNK
jgi:hypothetical protein